MSHTPDCAVTLKPLEWAPCTCFEPDTDWAPEQPCGGIATSVNGGLWSTPPWCEVHMKPWGHRRLTPAPTSTTAAVRGCLNDDGSDR